MNFEMSGLCREAGVRLKNNSHLVVFSNGDAWDASTWSNVPYMFLTTFGRLCPEVDIQVYDMSQIDTGLVSVLAKCWNRFVAPVKGAFCTFDRTAFRHRILRRKIEGFERAVPRGRGVLLSFDFSNPAPRLDGYVTSLLCDWTIDYAIREHQHREPTSGEQRLIERQKNAISSADLVVSLFPRSADLIRVACPEAKVAYYGLPANIVGGGVNANLNRANSRRLVFVGNAAYFESLKVVVGGLEDYNSSHPGRELGLDVIGMRDGPGSDTCVDYHGYLRKDEDRERAQYYELILNARALINVSDDWVGASSIVEAMSLGTPVVVTPNIELEVMLGDEGWGYWCACSPGAVAERLAELDALTDEALRRMCENAASAVEGFTWENLVRHWCLDVGLTVDD